MHNLCWFDGSVASPNHALLSAVSSSALYGKGVFTTLAIYNREPFLLEKHCRRLFDHAAKLGVGTESSSGESILPALLSLIETNSVVNGRARMTLFDRSASRMWQHDLGGSSGLLITTADASLPPHQLRLTVSPFRVNSTSPLAGIKSCNYLENLIAVEDARSRHFDEAVRPNERGEVTSACLANIFWRKDEKLYTPALSSGCLAGTTREFVMENIGCEEVSAGLEDLLTADSVFLTSAGFGIANVAEIDGSEFQFSDLRIPIPMTQ